MDAINNGARLVLLDGVDSADPTVRAEFLAMAAQRKVWGVEIPEGVAVVARAMSPKFKAALFEMAIDERPETVIQLVRSREEDLAAVAAIINELNPAIASFLRAHPEWLYEEDPATLDACRRRVEIQRHTPSARAWMSASRIIASTDLGAAAGQLIRSMVGDAATDALEAYLAQTGAALTASPRRTAPAAQRRHRNSVEPWDILDVSGSMSSENLSAHTAPLNGGTDIEAAVQTLRDAASKGSASGQPSGNDQPMAIFFTDAMPARIVPPALRSHHVAEFYLRQALSKDVWARAHQAWVDHIVADPAAPEAAADAAAQELRAGGYDEAALHVIRWVARAL